MTARSFSLLSTTNQPYQVVIPPAGPQERSGYAFAFHKSGSSLMFSMLQSYAEQTGLGFFSLHDAAFQQGVPTHEIQDDSLDCFTPSGYLYLGFRHYPSFQLPLDNKPVALLVRDPRDILVSLYYSVRESHVIPERNESLLQDRSEALEISLQEFVIDRSAIIKATFEQYSSQLFHLEGLKIYKYEDVIYDKRNWLLDMIDWFELPLKKKVARSVADKYDVIPSEEDPGSHVRRVHPGDHREKLSASVIRKLNDQLNEFLTEFGYL